MEPGKIRVGKDVLDINQNIRDGIMLGTFFSSSTRHKNSQLNEWSEQTFCIS